MISVPLNERELHAIDMVRMALSEETNDERLAGIRVVKLDVVSTRLEELNHPKYRGWQDDSRNIELVRWVTDTSSEWHDAAFDLGDLGQRFEKRNQRALNVAEEVGLEDLWAFEKTVAVQRKNSVKGRRSSAARSGQKGQV